MKIEISLRTREVKTDLGYPLAVVVSHQGKRKRKILGYCQEHHFLASEKTISSKHPDYDVFAPMLMNLKIKARKIIMQRLDDTEKAYDELFAVDFSQISFMDYGNSLVAEMEKMAATMAQFDIKAANKIKGNVKCYRNVLAQFENFGKTVTLQNLDFEILQHFKNYNLSIGNSKPTISMYLRTLRAVYNKGVLMHRLSDQKPFAKIFDGLKTRAYDSRKKHLDREAIFELETTLLFKDTVKQKYLDLFLLQFYFGGCDLIDLYYLKDRQLRKGRIVFERTKTNTGNRIDLKVHPKAQLIIDRYRVAGSVFS